MSNHFYVQFGKIPGQISKSMRTNVPNLEGWVELDGSEEENRRAVHEGGRYWYWDAKAGRPRRKDKVSIHGSDDRVCVGEVLRVYLEGVPADVKSVQLVINLQEEITLKRESHGGMEALDLEWDQPTPVTIELSQKNVTLFGEKRLFYFDEPEGVTQ